MSGWFLLKAAADQLHSGGHTEGSTGFVFSARSISELEKLKLSAKRYENKLAANGSELPMMVMPWIFEAPVFLILWFWLLVVDACC